MLRFTIRELVLLTLAVAMGVGWWIDHYQSEDRLIEWKAHAMETVLIKEGWSVEQVGWNVTIDSGRGPYPEYKFYVTLPNAPY